jgi:uncharacterized protein DUF4286
MASIVYTVYTTFTDTSLADAWLRWLGGGHIAKVLAGGALDTEIVELDTGAAERSFAVRYHFASRDSFAAYERDHAPRLRAEGLALFPVEKGVSYRRTIGVLVAVFPQRSRAEP